MHLEELEEPLQGNPPGIKSTSIPVEIGLPVPDGFNCFAIYSPAEPLSVPYRHGPREI